MNNTKVCLLQSLMESDFLSVLDLLHVHVEYTNVNDMEHVENLKDNVLILKDCEISNDICQKFIHCCAVESLIAAIMTGHFQIQGHSDVEEEVGAMDASKGIDTALTNIETNAMTSAELHIGRIESTGNDRANADGWVDVTRDASRSVLDDESTIVLPSCAQTQTIECTTLTQSELKLLGSFGRDKKHKMSCEESDASFQLPNYKAFRPKEPPVQSGVLVPMDETVYVSGNTGYSNWIKYVHLSVVY